MMTLRVRKQNLHHPCHLNSADKLLVIKLGRFWLKRGLSEEALNRNSRVPLQNLFNSAQRRMYFAKITASETSRVCVLCENMYSLGRKMAILHRRESAVLLELDA